MDELPTEDAVDGGELPDEVGSAADDVPPSAGARGAGGWRRGTDPHHPRRAHPAVRGVPAVGEGDHPCPRAQHSLEREFEERRDAEFDTPAIPDELSAGWSSDSSAWLPTFLWAAFGILVFVAAWLLGRRWRRLGAYGLAALPLAFILYFFLREPVPPTATIDLRP